MVRHDPERAAAAYLAGELSRRGRARFERHLLDCEDCWQQTNAARAGRMLAESLREAAPASLRERIRAITALSPAQPEPAARRLLWWPHLLIGTTAATLIALIVLLAPWMPPTQPAPLAAAAGLYHAGGPAPSSVTPSPPVRHIANYDWQDSTPGELAGFPATIHTYTNPAGHRLLIVASPRPFPRAHGAREINPPPSWIADIDGTTMICADQPGVSWLAVAANSGDALAAGRALGLTP